MCLCRVTPVVGKCLTRQVHSAVGHSGRWRINFHRKPCRFSDSVHLQVQILKPPTSLIGSGSAWRQHESNAGSVFHTPDLLGRVQKFAAVTHPQESCSWCLRLEARSSNSTCNNFELKNLRINQDGAVAGLLRGLQWWLVAEVLG